MTHALVLKGAGCREAELQGLDWDSLLDYVYDQKLNVSTIHIACDVFTDKFFTMNDLLKKFRLNHYVSSFRNTYEISGVKGKYHTGTSLYFGSRDGNQINIYDKHSERYYKGFEVDTNHWIRFEIRLKSKAQDFIRLYQVYTLEGLPNLYFGVLNSMLEFKSRIKASRIENRKIWSKWKDFINQEDKIKLYNQARIESNLTQKKNHLKDYYGAIMIEVLTSMDDSQKKDFFNEIIDEKLSKLTNKTLKRVNDERLKNGLIPFEDLDTYKLFIKENKMI
jgi:DNA relaxase NicK